MSTYFVGDIHGCYNNLRMILDTVRFNPNIDTLYLTGDLVSRGPKSLEVLRWVSNLSNKAKTVLGNHDLHLLQTYLEIHNHNNNNNNNKNFKSSFNSILQASDINELIHWLRHQSILYVNEEKKFLISHAGIHPNWNIFQAKQYAQEIEMILLSDNPHLLFYNLNKNNPLKTVYFSINKLKKIQNNLNIFTKMRYLDCHGQLNLKYKDIPKNAPSNIYPWFNIPNSIVPNYSIIFGHWATLKKIKIPTGFYGLDSGCCWGEKLTILKWEDKKITQIPCSPPA